MIIPFTAVKALRCVVVIRGARNARVVLCTSNPTDVFVGAAFAPNTPGPAWRICTAAPADRNDKFVVPRVRLARSTPASSVTTGVPAISSRVDFASSFEPRKARNRHRTDSIRAYPRIRRVASNLRCRACARAIRAMHRRFSAKPLSIPRHVGACMRRPEAGLRPKRWSHRQQ
jgi:hypothetical protein